jgi:hypothetical protein
MLGLGNVNGDRLMLQQASLIGRYFQSRKGKPNVEVMSVCDLLSAPVPLDVLSSNSILEAFAVSWGHAVP